MYKLVVRYLSCYCHDSNRWRGLEVGKVILAGYVLDSRGGRSARRLCTHLRLIEAECPRPQLSRILPKPGTRKQSLASHVTARTRLAAMRFACTKLTRCTASPSSAPEILCAYYNNRIVPPGRVHLENILHAYSAWRFAPHATRIYPRKPRMLGTTCDDANAPLEFIR